MFFSPQFTEATIMSESQTPKLALYKRGELRLDMPLQKGRPAHIAAASGLVRIGDKFFVVADDELHLGVFTVDDQCANGFYAEAPLRLLPGKLPKKIEKRKKDKPDFEVLTLLPASAEAPYGALLIMGSGSRDNRSSGILIPLTASGRPHHDQSLEIDFSELYAALQSEFSVVNIEGAVVSNKPQNGNAHSHLLLLQRGNKGLNKNAMAQLDLTQLTRELWKGEVSAAALQKIVPYVLGEIGGVPLGFSDATCLPDGRLLALAVAEDTDNAYADGATFGSCLCEFDQHIQLKNILPLDVPVKTEGLTLWSADEKILGIVTDADDPAIPASLYLLNCKGTRLDGLF
jgi:hypothetical protein